MGERATIDQDYLHDAADAIRRKDGTSNTYTPAQFEAAIDAIPTGGITPTGTINITENGDHDVTNYATASVNISGGGGVSVLSGTDLPTAAQGGNGEIYLRVSTDLDIIGTPTSDTPTGVVISASSYYGGYNPYKGFGAQELGWMPNGANGSLMVEFSSAHYVIQKLSFVDYMTYGGSIVIRNATTEFQGSNDGVTWDTLHTKSSHSTITGQVTTVVLNTNTPYSKFRFVCTGDGSNWSGLRGIVLTGYEHNGTPVVICDTYLKVSGAWQNLIGSNISDVGGVTA